MTLVLQDRLLLMPQVYNISTLLSEVLKLIPLDPEDPAAFLGHPGHLDRNVSGIAANKTRKDRHRHTLFKYLPTSHAAQFSYLLTSVYIRL